MDVIIDLFYTAAAWLYDGVSSGSSGNGSL